MKQLCKRMTVAERRSREDGTAYDRH